MDNRKAWEETLRNLAASLDEAEALLAQGELPEQNPTDFTPPLGLGPVPTELVPLVRRLQEKNEALLEKLNNVLDDLRKQRKALSKTTDYIPDSIPVYLNIEG